MREERKLNVRGLYHVQQLCILGGRIIDWVVICKLFTDGHRQSPDPRIISSLTETRIEQREEPFEGGGEA